MLRRLLEEKRFEEMLRVRTKLETKLLTGKSNDIVPRAEKTRKKANKQQAAVDLLASITRPRESTQDNRGSNIETTPVVIAEANQAKIAIEPELQATTAVIPAPAFAAEIIAMPPVAQTQPSAEKNIAHETEQPLAEMMLPEPVAPATPAELEAGPVPPDWLAESWQEAELEPIITAEEVERLLSYKPPQAEPGIVEPGAEDEQPVFANIIPETVSHKLAVYEEHANTEAAIELHASKVRVERASIQLEQLAEQAVAIEQASNEAASNDKMQQPLSAKIEDAKAELASVYGELLRRVGLEDEAQVEELIEDYINSIWQRARESQSVEVTLDEVAEEVFFERQLEQPELARRTAHSPGASISSNLGKAAQRIGRLLSKLTVNVVPAPGQ